MKYQDLSLLLLRVVFGGLMIINHGWGKLLRLVGDEPIKFADPIGLGKEISLGLAVFSEVLCALFIVLGIFTRYASMPLLVTMLVAAFIVHGDDPFKEKEAAILFAVPYLILMLTGGGKYSLENYFKK